MNVHGKNAWRVGPIGEHILEFDLVTPSGPLVGIKRESESELFHAAIGGIGLLGVFSRLRVQLHRTPCGWVDVEPISTPNLEAMFAAFAEREKDADYLVGWIDGTATGHSQGAFDLCQHYLKAVKTTLPIWKEPVFLS